MGSTPAELYLDLMKRVLTRMIFGDAQRPWLPKARRPLRRRAVVWLQRLLARRDLTLMRRVPLDVERRSEGLDQPADAETMVGLRRLDHLQQCLVQVLDEKVPGDLIETGVWRGGTCIFMRAVLAAYGDSDRCVWVADSFEGLPKPDAERHPADAGDRHWMRENLAVDLETVRNNFERYGLLDERVRFLKGWFSETLAGAPIERLAVLRLDGDMYASTIDALDALYPKLSVGGYLIVDDYSLPNCRAAVEDYRARHGITEPIEPIDSASVFWKRAR